MRCNGDFLHFVLAQRTAMRIIHSLTPLSNGNNSLPFDSMQTKAYQDSLLLLKGENIENFEECILFPKTKTPDLLSEKRGKIKGEGGEDILSVVIFFFFLKKGRDRNEKKKTRQRGRK